MHAKLPWRVCFPRSGMEHWHPQASPSVVDADGRDVLAQNVNHPGMLDEIRLNNAALIVSSVNARDEAIEAMGAAAGACMRCGLVVHADALRAAIEKLKGVPNA